MKTSKIKSVNFSHSWNKDGTDYYTHDYTFEDGGKIQANHMSKYPFGVGDEVEYEVKKNHEKHGPQGKVSKPNNFRGGGQKGGGYKPDTIGITIGNALNNVSLLIAHDKVELKDLEKTATRFVEVALGLKDKFKDKE